MPVEPAITERAAQPYVAIRRVVTMTTISEVADRIPEVFGWLGSRGVAPAGAPFLRYHVIDMARALEIDAGVPVATPVAAGDPLIADVLPAGRYATVTHVGPFDQLMGVTAALLAWAERQGLSWDAADTDRGHRWGGRIEIYHSNPAEEPDPARWVTELAFRLAD